MEMAGEPWVWLHADYTIPFMGHIYIIIINAHLKWLADLPVSIAISQRTVRKMKEAYVFHRILNEIVTDHRRCFTGKEFQQFVT